MVQSKELSSAVTLAIIIEKRAKRSKKLVIDCIMLEIRDADEIMGTVRFFPIYKFMREFCFFPAKWTRKVALSFRTVIAFVSCLRRHSFHNFHFSCNF